MKPENCWLNWVCLSKSKKDVIYIDEKVQTEDGEVDIELEDKSKGPEKIVEENDLKERLTNAIRKLPIEQRTMIVLRDIKGFTYMEIAEMTKTNLGTVKSKINRSRQALKEILDSEGTFLEYDESKM